MKRPYEQRPTQLNCVPTEQGESIEEMLRRIIANNEPVPANVKMIYTERKEGVNPDYDIRTDRQNIALDANDKFTASERMKSATKA